MIAIERMQAELLRRQYPSLAAAADEILDEIGAALPPRKPPDGTAVVESGKRPSAVPFVLQGHLRAVHQAGRDAHYTLYRVPAGQTCLLTTTAALSGRPAPVSLVAGARCELAMLADHQVLRLFDQCAAFRALLMGPAAGQLLQLMECLHRLATRRVDQRLAQYLLASGGGVTATHQQIARELGTAREVVTRKLQALAKRGLLEVRRKRVEVLDPLALARIASGSAPPQA